MPGPFDEMFREMSDRDERQQPQQPPHDAQIANLREFYERLTTPCPFKPGDLVTVIDKSTFTSIEQPHMVVEVYDPPKLIPLNNDTIGTPHAGAKYDILVLVWMGGSYFTYIVESWKFSLYVGKAEGVAQ